jgi:hypothetical protein
MASVIPLAKLVQPASRRLIARAVTALLWPDRQITTVCVMRLCSLSLIMQVLNITRDQLQDAVPFREALVFLQRQYGCSSVSAFQRRNAIFIFIPL